MFERRSMHFLLFGVNLHVLMWPGIDKDGGRLTKVMMCSVMLLTVVAHVAFARGPLLLQLSLVWCEVDG